MVKIQDTEHREQDSISQAESYSTRQDETTALNGNQRANICYLIGWHGELSVELVTGENRGGGTLKRGEIMVWCQQIGPQVEDIVYI